MFLTDRTTRILADHARARALETWRVAAQLVSTRWEIFLHAERERRSWAFASYVAALNAEEAAAAEMAQVAANVAA